MNTSHSHAGAPTQPWRDPTILTGIVINLVLCFYALLLARNDAEGLGRLLFEDGLAEWLQFLAFTVMAVVLALVAVERFSRARGVSLDAVVVAGCAGVVALAALEEISWFQRVLNIESPEFFRSNNRQGETNLHNITVGGSSLNKLILVKLIFVVGIVHNLVLPILARRSARLRQFVETWGLYIPPLAAALPYLGLVLLSHLVIRHGRAGELGEAFSAIHYLSTAFAAYGLGVNHARPGMFTAPRDRRYASMLFASLLLLLVFFAWLLAAAYTVPR